MEDMKTYHRFTGLRDLARLGLWEQASFHSAELYNDFQVYRDDNGIYFSCQLENETHLSRALLWVFE